MKRLQIHNLSGNNSRKIFLVSNLLISFGILLTTIGGGWDITNHLLNKPETFFSPPHAMLYSGIAIALFATIAMFVQWNKMPSDQKSYFRFSVRLSVIGIYVLIFAGPIDFFWHDSFGLDGLLSPPHLTLISGMFLCSIGSMNRILRLGKAYKKRTYSVDHFFIVLAILPVWMVSSGFFYSFSLPFSRTDYFDFNPEIYFAAIFATISMPLLNSTILILTSKLANYKFGVLSITAISLLVINLSNSIMPNPSLVGTIPFYLLTIIPLVAADAILAMSQKGTSIFTAGIITSVIFYFLYFPLITHVYNEVIYNRIVSASITSNIYFEMMPVVFPIIIGPSIIMGIVGVVFAKKIFAKIH